MEYAGSTRSAAFDAIEETIRANTEQVLEESRRERTLPRRAAERLALRRVEQAMSYRRWSIF
jgi:glutamate dehydrogenase (NAD(P)+)